MGITDWDEWMSKHHIKIYTEEELRKKKLKTAVHNAVNYAKKHKTEFLKAVNYFTGHA